MTIKVYKEVQDLKLIHRFIEEDMEDISTVPEWFGEYFYQLSFEEKFMFSMITIRSELKQRYSHEALYKFWSTMAFEESVWYYERKHNHIFPYNLFEEYRGYWIAINRYIPDYNSYNTPNHIWYVAIHEKNEYSIMMNEPIAEAWMNDLTIYNPSRRQLHYIMDLAITKCGLL